MTQRKPWLPTVIILGIALLLVAFSIWIVPLLNKPSQPGGDDAPAPPVVFFNFQGIDIVCISVTKGYLMTSVERQGTTWAVTAPAEEEADSARLDMLADTVARMQATRTLEDVNPTDFGLLEPTAEVTIEVNDGRTAKLTIGDEVPGGTGRYVQRADDANIYIVPINQASGLLNLVDNPPYPPTPIPPTQPPSPEQTPTAEP